MTGSVTISLEDFKKLEGNSTGGIKMKEDAVELRKEVDRVLTYINQFTDMAAVASKYNAFENSNGEILIEGSSCTLVRKKRKD